VYRENKLIYDFEPRPSMLNKVKNAALALGAIAVLYFGANSLFGDQYDRHRQCVHRVKSGETLDSIAAGEGLNGQARVKFVQHVCGENEDRAMPDGKYPAPVFYIGEGPDSDCSNMMAGGEIIVPDMNDDGKVGGHTCRDSRE
jgi:hypothetical protein